MPDTERDLIPVVDYSRASADKAKDEHTVEDQQRVNARTAARLGCRIVHRFKDNDKSAAKEGVVRNDFEEMLRVVRAGRLADGTPVMGVIVTADDRLVRRAGDYERFVDALTYHDGRVYADARGFKDLYSEDVESMGLMGAVFARMEVKKTRRRVRRWHRSRAERGIAPAGPRPFGWQADRVTPDPPEDVSSHPRVFATLTAPSFGAVHTHREKAGKTLPCRPRRDDPTCGHGRPEGCRRRHESDERTLGQPICVDCYDYPAAVLWNAHAAELWRRFMLALPKRLAARIGITRKAFRQQARIGYARVIEYQRRGLIHFHTVIRLDGPAGPDSPPPAWATAELLTHAIHEAAEDVTVSVAAPDGSAEDLALTWGTQLDVQPVYVAAELDGITDKNVARYIAKYATKGAEASGTVDRPIRTAHQVEALRIDEHARRMIWTCIQLAEFPQYADLRLRQWAHMLGFGGHFSTKSRRYSTTLGALRQERAAYQAAEAQHDEDDAGQERPTLTVAHWQYAGSGYLHGEEVWANAIRDRVQTARHIRRQNTQRHDGEKAS